MKTFTLLIGLISLCFTLQAQTLKTASPTCLVEGHIRGMQGEVPVQVIQTQRGKITKTLHSGKSVNGDFSFTVPACEEVCELQFGNNSAHPMFFAESGNVRIEGHVDSLFFSRPSGTRANEEWRQYRLYSEKLGQWRGQQLVSSDMKALDEAAQQQKRKEIMAEYDRRMDAFLDSLNTDGCSLVALYVTWNTLVADTSEKIDSILGHFRPEMKDNAYYQALEARRDVLKRTAPGAKAPLFSVVSLNGDSISLSEFQGKYVILDFWASWCVPCRGETKFVKALYQKFHTKGLEVFSVSLDQDEQKWRQAVKQDSMVWRHGILTGNLKQQVSDLYGVQAIPAIWVIDPQGKIIARGLRREKLQTFVEELFKQTQEK